MLSTTTQGLGMPILLMNVASDGWLSCARRCRDVSTLTVCTVTSPTRSTSLSRILNRRCRIDGETQHENATGLRGIRASGFAPSFCRRIYGRVHVAARPCGRGGGRIRTFRRDERLLREDSGAFDEGGWKRKQPDPDVRIGRQTYLRPWCPLTGFDAGFFTSGFGDVLVAGVGVALASGFFCAGLGAGFASGFAECLAAEP